MRFHVQQAEGAENHLSWWEASGSTGWAGGRTVCTASCWLTRPDNTFGIYLEVTSITLSYIHRFQGSQSSRDLQRSWCMHNHPWEVMSRGRNHFFAYLQRGSSEFVSSYRPAKGPVPFTWSGTCPINWNAATTKSLYLLAFHTFWESPGYIWEEN